MFGEQLQHIEQAIRTFTDADKAMLNRRGFLAVLGGSGLALVGCSSQPKNVPGRTEVPKVAPDNLPAYPEIESFPLKSKGRFEVAGGAVEWLNYSPFDFNQDRAQLILNALRSLPSQANNFRYKIGNAERVFDLIARQNSRRRIYLIPETAPWPSWKGFTDTDARTRRVPLGENGEESVIVIRVKNQQPVLTSGKPETVEGNVNTHFAVEAAQSSIKINNPDIIEAAILQELFCNEWGRMLLFKASGLTYPEYSQIASSSTVTAPSGIEIPSMVMPASVYQLAPNNAWEVIGKK